MEESEVNQVRADRHARCVNLDWLEVYCHESQSDYPHDAAFFMNSGWEVVVRPYGTRVYDEMFTLYDSDHLPLLEVRRKPAGAFEHGKKTILDPYSCHIRLHNRTCYRDDAADFLQAFLVRYGYEFQRISRVDICLDFERFDRGDDPGVFLRRYMAGRYSKINQANIGAHGCDMWDGRQWNSVSWGSRTSMVGTKFYNKSRELREGRDKPYIRQAWCLCGLVDDFVTCQKRKRDGTLYRPDIWRVEFSMKSSVKGWVVLEDCHGRRKQLRSVRNTLGCYRTRPQLLDVFASLASHYFYFKHFEAGKRKDRCETKVLFDFTTQADFYRIEKPATATATSPALLALQHRLEAYLHTSVDYRMNHAIIDLLEIIKDKRVVQSAACPWDANEVELLRRLVAVRTSGAADEPVSVTRERVENLMAIEGAIF